MKNFFSKLFRFGWERHDPIETYLANSVDLVDVESTLDIAIERF